MAPLFLQNLFAHTCGLAAVVLVSGCSSPGPAKWASNQRPVHNVWGGPQHLSPGTEALLTGGSSEVAADTRRQAGAVEQINALIQRMAKDPSPMADDAVLRAYLFSLRVVSHNIANVNTCGYRRSEVVFGEGLEGFRLSARTDSSVPATPLANGLLPELECSVRRSFRQGPLKPTGERMDIAILGEGFLEVQMPDGTAGYTRAGILVLTGAGEWVTREGFRLVGFSVVFPGTTYVSISPAGTVNLTGGGGVEMFQIPLARFANPSGLRPLAENVYAATEASGPPEMGSPDSGGFGKIYQGYLELSNVDLAVELQELIRLHSAYESYRSARKVLDAVARDLNPPGPGPLAPKYDEWIEASVSR